MDSFYGKICDAYVMDNEIRAHDTSLMENFILAFIQLLSKQLPQNFAVPSWHVQNFVATLWSWMEPQHDEFGITYRWASARKT